MKGFFAFGGVLLLTFVKVENFNKGSVLQINFISKYSIYTDDEYVFVFLPNLADNYREKYRFLIFFDHKSHKFAQIKLFIFRQFIT